MMKDFKKEFDKGMPSITYIKKKFGFQSIDEFEAYIAELKEKAQKYDEMVSKNHK